MYKLTGYEQKEESTEKIPCGEAVTTKYFNGDKLVRVDKKIIVTAGLMAQAMQGKL